MNSKISRRDFMKASATGAAIAGTTCAVAEQISRPPGHRGGDRVEMIATNCEMCFWRCGVLAEVKDGKVLKLQGNPNHPMTKGKLCARGNSGTQLLYDPDRLKYPQVRTGSRGAGKLKRISWDEALDQFAGKLKEIKQKYGPETVAIFPHGVGSGFFSTVMKAYGTPNGAETAFAQCFGPRDVAYLLTFGRPVGSPEPHLERQDRALFLNAERSPLRPHARLSSPRTAALRLSPADLWQGADAHDNTHGKQCLAG